MFVWRWEGAPGAWRAQPLTAGQGVALGPQARLLPLRSGRCGLLVGGRVTVNGLPALPLRILQDRDEIRIDGQTMYLSADGPTGVTPFSGEASARCGRCKGPMQDGEGAVRCPRCRTWHHQTEERLCWTYDQRCSGCDRPTTGAAWQPEPWVSESPWPEGGHDG